MVWPVAEDLSQHVQGHGRPFRTATEESQQMNGLRRPTSSSPSQFPRSDNPRLFPLAPMVAGLGHV